MDRRDGVTARTLASAVAELREPRTTMAGVNLVAGFRPELWRRVSPTGVPRGLEGFNQDLKGADGFVMPATQHDLVLWFAGAAYDLVFDQARGALRSMAKLVRPASETAGWPYHHDRDLTGFLDGTENPPVTDAPGVAVVPAGKPGAGGSVLLVQKWKHEIRRWESLSDSDQEKVIGRTKSDSTELDPKPADAHVTRTDQDRFGKIFRRNLPYGDVSEHGTLFLGFCADRRPLQSMLESMAGVPDGVRDALTRYSRPLTGGYYFVPSSEAIGRFRSRS